MESKIRAILPLLSDDFEPFEGGKRGIKNVKCRVNCLVLSVNRERVLPWRET